MAQQELSGTPAALIDKVRSLMADGELRQVSDVRRLLDEAEDATDADAVGQALFHLYELGEMSHIRAGGLVFWQQYNPA